MKKIMLIAGPALAVLAWIALFISGFSASIAWTASVVIWAAVWWIFEPIPISITSLLPIAILPLAGVLDAKQVGAAYGDPLVLLMMGGFMLSMAMEKSGTHRRNCCNDGSRFRRPAWRQKASLWFYGSFGIPEYVDIQRGNRLNAAANRAGGDRPQQ